MRRSFPGSGAGPSSAARPAVLVLAATPAEAERLPPLRGARVVVGGIGAVNAALSAQAAILERRPELVLSVGIGGAYPGSGLQPGDVVVGSEAVFAALGAEDEAGFLDLERLGFPLVERPGDPVFNRLPAALAGREFAWRAGAAFGPILTLETVTGSTQTAARLEARVPGALVEAMEGGGVALAAARSGLGFLEVRGVSNPVGPRDRSSWLIGLALERLGAALTAGWPTLVG